MRIKMSEKILVTFMLSTSIMLQAQSLNLSGRVVDSYGTAVSDATVKLKTQGASTKTGANGAFVLGANSGIQAGNSNHFKYRIENGFLALELQAPLKLHTEITDGSGRHQGGFDRTLGEGKHQINLSDAMPALEGKVGLYFLQLQLEGKTFTHPFFYFGNGSAKPVFAPHANTVAAKKAATADTLLVTKTGYQDYVKQITNYTAGNLGDLVLAPPGTKDGWTSIFNGKDLTGWVPLIHKWAYNQDPYHTFRADSVNHVIQVLYDQYPNQNFDDHCGLLYYNKFLVNYRIRLTYRFLEPQAQNPVSWGKYNSGLMIFGIDPAKVTGDPEFPPLVEIQLLGKGSSGGSTNPNECEPGNAVTMKVRGADCGDNHTGKAPNPPDQWTTVEANVHLNGDTKIYQYPDTTKPVFTMTGPPTYNNQPLTGGYISLQSESQPLEFKDIQIIELP